MDRNQLKEKLSELVDKMPDEQIAEIIFDEEDGFSYKLGAVGSTDFYRISSEEYKKKSFDHRARTFELPKEKRELDAFILDMMDSGWDHYETWVCGPTMTVVFSKERENGKSET